jgi:hypothetical protein
MSIFHFVNQAEFNSDFDQYTKNTRESLSRVCFLVGEIEIKASSEGRKRWFLPCSDWVALLRWRGRAYSER